MCICPFCKGEHPLAQCPDPSFAAAHQLKVIMKEKRETADKACALIEERHTAFRTRAEAVRAQDQEQVEDGDCVIVEGLKLLRDIFRSKAEQARVADEIAQIKQYIFD